MLGVILIFLILGGTTIGSLYLLRADPALIESQRELLTNSAHRLLRLLLFAALLCSLLFSVIGLYLSYTFIGSLYRLETWLEERIQNGDYVFFKIRPGDELEPAVNVLNRMLEHSFKPGAKNP